MRKLLIAILVSVVFILSAGKTNAQTHNKSRKSAKNEISEELRLKFEFAFLEAQKALAMNETEKAVSLFTSCLAIDPTSAVCMYELSNIYYRVQNFNSALELARGAVKLQPANVWYQIRLASIFKAKGMVDNACSVYDDLIKMHPHKKQYYYIEAELFTAVEKFSKALAVYKRLEKVIGVNEDVCIKMHSLYMALGKKKNAYSLVRKLIKHFPFNIQNYGILADMYLSDHQNEKAFVQYQKILEIEPTNGVVQFYLAEYYRSKKEFAKANSALLIAFGSGNINADKKIQYLLSVCLSDSNYVLSDDTLHLLYKALVKTHPEHVHANALYADYLRKHNDPKGARVLLRKILTKEVTNRLVWEELLLIDNELLDFQSMFDDSSKALKYFPMNPMLYMFKGVSAAQNKNYKIAIETFNLGFDLIGKNIALRVQFLSYLGDAYYQIGDATKAFKAYDEVLLFDSKNVIVLNNYSYYLSERKENLEKAKSMSLKCVDLEKDNSTYLDTHAWVLYMMGEYTEAKKFLAKALKFGGRESAVIIEHYGDVLYRLGDKKAALVEWINAEKVGEGSKQLPLKIKNGEITE